MVARLVAVRAGAPRDFLASGLVELNGWFLGVAIGTFFASGRGSRSQWCWVGPWPPVSRSRCVGCSATWDVPLMVGPYMPAFWILAYALPAFPWFHAGALPIPTYEPASRALLVLIGGLRGLGEIFFLPDARVGVGLAIAASIADWGSARR